MKTDCHDKRICCFRDQFGRCKVLHESLNPCRFAKPTKEAKPYDLKKRKKKYVIADRWPY